MPALDDYHPPAPTWLAIAVVLDQARQPLLLATVRDELQRSTRGRCGQSYTQMLRSLERMSTDGIVEVTPWSVAGVDRRLYSLSPVGRELVAEARDLARQTLAL